LLAVCLIGILLAVGLVLASCGGKCPGSGDCKFAGAATWNFCTDSSCAVTKEYNKSGSKDNSVTCDCK
jgi:hypothetical protein